MQYKTAVPMYFLVFTVADILNIYIDGAFIFVN